MGEHVWSCQYCDETFYEIVGLNKHLNSTHQLIEIIYPLPNGWKKNCQKGRNNAAKDWNVYVTSPDGKMFRSCVEIKEYLITNPEVKCDKSLTNIDQPSNLEKICNTRYIATKACTSDNSEKLTDFESIVMKEEQESIKVGNVFSFEDPIMEESIRELMKSVQTEAQDSDNSEKVKNVDSIIVVKDEKIVQNSVESATDGKTLVILEQRIVPENNETIYQGKYPGNLYVQEKDLPQAQT